MSDARHSRDQALHDARLTEKLGYRFSDNNLFQDALTHRSCGARNNERLEFLGDAVLNFIIADALFARFPGASEGELSRLRAQLVKRETLAKLARHYQLGDHLRLGPGELKSGGFRRDSILADALEGMLGAVYLDGGLSAVQDLILRLYDKLLKALNLQGELKDPKTRLQEYLQARRLPLPTYEVVSIEGKEHQQVFRVACCVSGFAEPVQGAGESRRKAEQDAAGKAFTLLDHDA